MFKEGFLSIGPSEYLKIYAVSITLAFSNFSAVNKKEQLRTMNNTAKNLKRTTKSYLNCRNWKGEQHIMTCFKKAQISTYRITVNLPCRSLHKLCPTKIVPSDNNFFKRFYNINQQVRKKESCIIPWNQIEKNPLETYK